MRKMVQSRLLTGEGKEEGSALWILARKIVFVQGTSEETSPALLRIRDMAFYSVLPRLGLDYAKNRLNMSVSSDVTGMRDES